MERYRHDDFTKNEAWLVFPLDVQIQSQSADVYFAMDVWSAYILGQEIALGDGLTSGEAQRLLETCKAKADGALPKTIILPKGDPSEAALAPLADRLGLQLEIVPGPALEDLVAPVKKSFGESFFSPSTIPYAGLKDDVDQLERESAKHFVPGTYDPCPCASGKKYKFCCKPIFREITGAMAAIEQGLLDEALHWIAKAKALVGETAEVLCREAIVRSKAEPDAAQELLERCLAQNPNHPRAHYVLGVDLKESGKLMESIAAYQAAIANYPKTDRYHLNEAYNNLGTALYEVGDYGGAKAAWEQGLILLPSDRMTRNNLRECIYENQALPPDLREMSPFVRRFFAS